MPSFMSRRVLNIRVTALPLYAALAVCHLAVPLPLIDPAEARQMNINSKSRCPCRPCVEQPLLLASLQLDLCYTIQTIGLCRSVHAAQTNDSIEQETGHRLFSRACGQRIRATCRELNGP